jgi:hypothetical protein
MDDKILDILKLEYNELNDGINTYSTRTFRTLGGFIALTIPIIWYSLQKPGSIQRLALIYSLILHSTIISLFYFSIVYRTLKETKRIQAARINALLDNEQVLIWEDLWDRIWGFGILSRTKLSWLIFGLFIALFLLMYISVSILGCLYLYSIPSYISTGIANIYIGIMILLPYFEIRIFFNNMRKVKNHLNNLKKELKLEEQ